MAKAYKEYGVPLERVPRISSTDEEAEKRIRNMTPVILTDTNLVTSALKWDLDYLVDNLGEEDFTVFVSDKRIFKYYDEGKVKEHKLEGFDPPAKREEMKIWEFAKKLKSNDGKKYYLQQSLNDAVGKNIVKDFLCFNWEWATKQQSQNSWGPLTSNLLLIASEGNITPAHYDEQQNLFGQLVGQKRFLLFAPEQFECLYPHPVWHPHDRQSQVDFDHPDLERFPNFKKLCGYEAIINPGDVLYVPMYWWHQVESSMQGSYTVSVNFWYKSGPVEKVVYPLMGHQKMAIMRNVEKMITEALKDVNEVGPLLRTLVIGRYT
ncbi:hypoxia-inducible factor 1-alpha inhibitor-like [Ornithodoros turicata]|uniref:hypoxia-inducible factor 1-alpha inhibitor-like n=1 Tax=Ornithodoros turicata TaxID=34597 RepID=UPI00313A179B